MKYSAKLCTTFELSNCDTDDYNRKRSVCETHLYHSPLAAVGHVIMFARDQRQKVAGRANVCCAFIRTSRHTSDVHDNAAFNVNTSCPSVEPKRGIIQ